MKVCYLGTLLSLVDNPMRGQTQSVFRTWSERSKEPLEEVFMTEYDFNEINRSGFDVLVYSLDKYYSKDFFDNHALLDKNIKLVGFSVELFDTYNRKSTYPFFNDVTQSMLNHWYKSGLNERTSLIIGTAKNKPIDYDGDYFYYPYYLAPSIFCEDKLGYLESRVKESPKIEGMRDRNICMVYQRENYWREFISNALDVITFYSGGMTYSGKYKNNDRSIPFNYDYDIVNEYYTKFNFNLVVENEFCDGWVTEKLINPLLAGCVPIYYDPFNQFPDRFLNHDACLIINDRNIGDLCCMQSPRDIRSRFIGKSIFNKEAGAFLESFRINAVKVINKLCSVY